MKRTDASLNAELKHLRLRIKKLEEIVLNSKEDCGTIKQTVKKEKKG